MKVRGEKLTVKRIVRFIKRSVFEHGKMLIFEMDVNEIPNPIENKTKVEISLLNIADLDFLIRGKRSTHKQTMLERLDYGDKCFVAKKDNKICGYVWIRKNKLYFTEVYYEVETDDRSIWVYDELVFEEERGKRIQQKILFKVLKYCKNMGYKRILTGILSDNEPSLNAHARFGFKKLVKEIEMRKVLGIKRHKVIDHGNE